MQDNNNINFKKSHYKHLTSSERGQIQAYLNEGKSIRFIAKSLDKSPSTISREVKRNSISQMDSLYGFKNFYIADTADIYYLKRREKCKFVKKYEPQFFIELKEEVLKKEYRKFSIDAFCAVYKRIILIKLSRPLKLYMK